MYTVIAIAVGAVLGALLRWGLGLWLNGIYPAVPMGTLAANLLGGYLIGLAIAFFAFFPNMNSEWRLFIITGFLGALTTFSTFSAEVAFLLQQGRWLLAGGTVALHVLGSLAMTFLGMASFSLVRHFL